MGSIADDLKHLADHLEVKYRVYMSPSRYETSGYRDLFRRFPDGQTGYCGTILDTEYYVCEYVPTEDADGNPILGVKLKADEPYFMQPKSFVL